MEASITPKAKLQATIFNSCSEYTYNNMPLFMYYCVGTACLLEGRDCTHCGLRRKATSEVT
jgi:hypothetical protein